MASNPYDPSESYGGSFRLMNRFSGGAEGAKGAEMALIGNGLRDLTAVENSRLAYERARQAAKASEPSGLDKALGIGSKVAGIASGVAGTVGAIAAI